MSKKPTVVGGINLTTKVKSKGFWVATVPIIATFITSILSLLGVEVAEEVINQYTAIAGVIISLLAQFGVLVDFNTKGIKDSPIAQGYTAPRNSNNPDEHIEYIKNINQPDLSVNGIFEPKDYTGELEPDTDTSDEVLAENDRLTGGGIPEEEDKEDLGKVFAEGGHK